MGYYDDEDSYFSNYDREEQQRWDDIDRENRYQEEQDYLERERQWRIWDDEENDRRSSFLNNDDDSSYSSYSDTSSSSFGSYTGGGSAGSYSGLASENTLGSLLLAALGIGIVGLISSGLSGCSSMVLNIAGALLGAYGMFARRKKASGSISKVITFIFHNWMRLYCFFSLMQNITAIKEKMG